MLETLTHFFAFLFLLHHRSYWAVLVTALLYLAIPSPLCDVKFKSHVRVSVAKTFVWVIVQTIVQAPSFLMPSIIRKIFASISKFAIT